MADGAGAEQAGRGAEYLSPSQTAELLHVSPKTVTRWATQGRLPAIVTLGGHRRFRRSDVEAIRALMEHRD